MKQVYLFCLFVFSAHLADAQLLKRIGKSAQQSAEQRAKVEATKRVNQGVDKVLTKKEKKQEEKKQPKESEAVEKPAPVTEQSQPVAASQPIAPAPGKEPVNDDQNIKDGGEGFIEMQLSSPIIFTGGTLTISGRSGVYEKLNKIDMKITGPGLTNDYPVYLDKDGNFTAKWIAPATAGHYTVIAFSSDKKSQKSVDFTVEYLDELDEMANENIEVMENIRTTFAKRISEAKSGMSSKHKSETDAKMQELESRVAKSKEVFNKINEAGKIISKAASNGSVLPKNISANMSDLKDALQTHKEESQKLLEAVNHRTTGYTICDRLEMVVEAAAAFSTFSNFQGKLGQVAINLATDKVQPTAATILNEHLFNKKVPNEAVVPAIKFITQASTDAKGLVTGSGPQGFAGDMAQAFANIYLNEYCKSFEGDVTHDYTVTFRTSSNITWWKYGYVTNAKITLRYPKSGDGSIVQMKGHIEGNAVKFSFYQNVTEEEEFQSISKGRVQLIQLAVFSPPAIPVASSQHDKAGFGMMARAVATPAYFNLPIDATYNKDAGTIRIFMTEGGIDFTPMVRNRVLLVSPIPVPIFKLQEFPINKAKLTMNAVIKRYGEYNVIADGKGGLRFAGTKTHHVGQGSELETKVNVTISAKN